jgi:hypothetical protein
MTGRTRCRQPVSRSLTAGQTCWRGYQPRWVGGQAESIANQSEGQRRVVLAANIAGMLVLMGTVNDIEDGLHDLNETSRQ